MSNPNILILGRDAGMMQNVMAFLGQHGFRKAKGVLTNEDVLAELATGRSHVLIIGGGVDNETRKMIRQLMTQKNIRTKTVEHFGNPSSLPDEIRSVII